MADRRINNIPPFLAERYLAAIRTNNEAMTVTNPTPASHHHTAKPDHFHIFNDLNAAFHNAPDPPLDQPPLPVDDARNGSTSPSRIRPTRGGSSGQFQNRDGFAGLDDFHSGHGHGGTNGIPAQGNTNFAGGTDPSHAHFGDQPYHPPHHIHSHERHLRSHQQQQLREPPQSQQHLFSQTHKEEDNFDMFRMQNQWKTFTTHQATAAPSATTRSGISHKRPTEMTRLATGGKPTHVNHLSTTTTSEAQDKSLQTSLNHQHFTHQDETDGNEADQCQMPLHLTISHDVNTSSVHVATVNDGNDNANGSPAIALSTKKWRRRKMTNDHGWIKKNQNQNENAESLTQQTVSTPIGEGQPCHDAHRGARKEEHVSEPVVENESTDVQSKSLPQHKVSSSPRSRMNFGHASNSLDVNSRSTSIPVVTHSGIHQPPSVNDLTAKSGERIKSTNATNANKSNGVTAGHANLNPAKRNTWDKIQLRPVGSWTNIKGTAFQEVEDRVEVSHTAPKNESHTKPHIQNAKDSENNAAVGSSGLNSTTSLKSKSTFTTPRGTESKTGSSGSESRPFQVGSDAKTPKLKTTIKPLEVEARIEPESDDGAGTYNINTQTPASISSSIRSSDQSEFLSVRTRLRSWKKENETGTGNNATPLTHSTRDSGTKRWKPPITADTKPTPNDNFRTAPPRDNCGGDSAENSGKVGNVLRRWRPPVSPSGTIESAMATNGDCREKTIRATKRWRPPARENIELKKEDKEIKNGNSDIRDNLQNEPQSHPDAEFQGEDRKQTKTPKTPFESLKERFNTSESQTNIKSSSPLPVWKRAAKKENMDSTPSICRTEVVSRVDFAEKRAAKKENMDSAPSIRHTEVVSRVDYVEKRTENLLKANMPSLPSSKTTLPWVNTSKEDIVGNGQVYATEESKAKVENVETSETKADHKERRARFLESLRRASGHGVGKSSTATCDGDDLSRSRCNDYNKCPSDASGSLRPYGDGGTGQKCDSVFTSGEERSRFLASLRRGTKPSARKKNTDCCYDEKDGGRSDDDDKENDDDENTLNSKGVRSVLTRFETLSVDVPLSPQRSGFKPLISRQEPPPNRSTVRFIKEEHRPNSSSNPMPSPIRKSDAVLLPAPEDETSESIQASPMYNSIDGKEKTCVSVRWAPQSLPAASSVGSLTNDYNKRKALNQVADEEGIIISVEDSKSYHATQKNEVKCGQLENAGGFASLRSKFEAFANGQPQNVDTPIKQGVGVKKVCPDSAKNDIDDIATSKNKTPTAVEIPVAVADRSVEPTARSTSDVKIGSNRNSAFQNLRKRFDDTPTASGPPTNFPAISQLVKPDSTRRDFERMDHPNKKTLQDSPMIEVGVDPHKEQEIKESGEKVPSDIMWEGVADECSPLKVPIVLHRKETFGKVKAETTTQQITEIQTDDEKAFVAQKVEVDIRHGAVMQEQYKSSMVARKTEIDMSYGDNYLDCSYEDDDCDGVTLSPTPSDVSSLSIPSCIRSLEASIVSSSTQTSDELTNLESVTEKQSTTLGVSEASSSQTSEAATPLIRSTLGNMRMKFTTSSDTTTSFNGIQFSMLGALPPPIDVKEGDEGNEGTDGLDSKKDDKRFVPSNQFEDQLSFQSGPKWKNDFFTVDSVKSHQTTESTDASPSWVEFSTSSDVENAQGRLKSDKVKSCVPKQHKLQGVTSTGNRTPSFTRPPSTVCRSSIDTNLKQVARQPQSQGRESFRRGDSIKQRLQMKRVGELSNDFPTSLTTSQSSDAENEDLSQLENRALNNLQRASAYRRFNIHKVRAARRSRASFNR